MSLKMNLTRLATGILWIGLPVLLLGAKKLEAADKPNGGDQVEVFTTGSEQAVIESFVRKPDESSEDRFSNSLDQALAVLIARAYPKPEPKSLARATVDALCKEFERQTGSGISADRHDGWVADSTRTGSFDSVLKSLTAPALKQDELIKAGLNGMLKASGWDSAGVLPPAYADELKKMMKARGALQQEPGMLGVKLDRWPAVDVVPGSPAAGAGLQNGDVLVAVNGEDVTGVKTVADALKLLQGPAGGAVKLSVKRDGRTLNFEVTRAPAAAAMVEASEPEANILLIKIPTFEGSGIADAVKRLIHTRAANRQSAVILDLRDNPGGRGEEADGVAGIFLDNQQLMICKFRDGKRIAFKSNAGAVAVPLFLLTNAATGSAAEMLAMALQDHSRAVIVGENTAGALFGKDGAELAGGETIIFRTDPTLLSPSGHDYSLTGVPPDVSVRDSRSEGGDDVLARALELARATARK